MVLVDSSVWIDFLKKGASLESALLSSLLEQAQDVATCGLIRQEVLQGIRNDLVVRKVGHLLAQAYYLFLDEPSDFDRAAEIYRNLRARGTTIRSPADCLIAAIAIRSDIPLLQRDRDFLTIARFCDLKLLEAD